MDSAGAVLGPLLALLLLPRIGLRGVFWAAAVPGALAVVIVAAGVKENAEDGNRRLSGAQQLKGQESKSITLPGSFYYVLCAVTLFSLGNSSDMFLILRAQTAGISAAHAPLLGLLFNTTYTAAAWPAGHLSDRVPKHFIAASGYVVFATTYFLFARAQSAGVIWGAMALYGFYYALTDAVLRALVAQTVPIETRGRAFGIYFFAVSIATLLASIATGELWKHFGPALPLEISAGMALAAAVMLAVKREPARQ
jgi:MFS family permease